MDPNACLARIREIIEKGSHPLDHQDAEDLAENIDALDGWLSRGGFLPVEWTNNRNIGG